MLSGQSKTKRFKLKFSLSNLVLLKLIELHYRAELMQVTIRGYIRRSVQEFQIFWHYQNQAAMEFIYKMPMRFLKSLTLRNIGVLRWFEDLPHLDADEDLDLLVADSDFSRIKRVLQRGKGGVKGFVQFDIYPESNLEGDIAYYPPHLASQILKTRRAFECGVWVPSPRIFSVAYLSRFVSQRFQSDCVAIFQIEIFQRLRETFQLYFQFWQKKLISR